MISGEQNASAIWNSKEQWIQECTLTRHRPETDCAKVGSVENLTKQRIKRSGRNIFGFLQVSDDE